MEAIADGEDVLLEANGQRWLNSWHGPGPAPEGRPHGSAGICVTPTGEIILISEDGARWDLPAGRPEAGEGWEDTLRREMMEEACAFVRSARLLGYARGRCIEGHEEGLVLVRAFWRAEVDLLDWEPRYEVTHRRVVKPADVLSEINIEQGYFPTLARALREAGL